MNNKGFSLIEVLISLVILAIGLLAIAGMQVTSIRGNSFSNNVTQTTIFAQDKMEELKNITYANVTSNSDTKTVSGTIFSRQWNVVEDAGNNIKTITVTVQWTDGTTHSISLSTIRSK